MLQPRSLRISGTGVDRFSSPYHLALRHEISTTRRPLSLVSLGLPGTPVESSVGTHVHSSRCAQSLSLWFARMPYSFGSTRPSRYHSRAQATYRQLPACAPPAPK